MIRDVINKALSTVLLLIVLLPVGNNAYCEDNKILISDYLGNWTGKTSQGHPISFRVEKIDGVVTVTEVKYKMKLTGSSFSMTKTMMQPTTVKAKITKSEFKHSSSFDFSGTFVKKNLVEGQLKEVYIHPQGYGKAVGYVSYSAAKEGTPERINIKTPKPPKPPQKGPKRAQIIEVQRLLAKLGFSPGPADGLIGLKTERAVREFQKSSGITVDGKITKNLLEQLIIQHLKISQHRTVSSTENVGDFECGVKLNDKRDGKKYKTVQIGSQCWMAENLNFSTDCCSSCYSDSERNCEKFGRLYEWKIAKNVCPEGWHLPSHDEWNELEKSVGAGEVVQKWLWRGNHAKKLKVGGKSDFNVIMAGIYNSAQGAYQSIDGICYLWTSTDHGGGLAKIRGFGLPSESVLNAESYYENRLSVRCVKND